MVVTRGGFSQVVGNAFAGLGFPADGPTVYEFPVDMFLPESDLTPINENIDKIVYGLTKWQPEIKEPGIYAPARVMVEGKDYEEALANMNLLFLKNMWGDGLSILPATEERVNWILTGTDLSPDAVVAGGGKILPRGGIASVESLAVCLAMVGGRPEYMPLLIAIAEAITEPECDPGFNPAWCPHQAWNATTCSIIPTLIVNGPIAKQIRLSSGYGCLGPDPLHPAGGPIGRAVRIMLQDMGGAVPGVGTMAIYGGARHTGIIFAEDEDGSPWEPLSVERGFPNGSNVVTLFPLTDIHNLHGVTQPLQKPLKQAATVMMGCRRNARTNNPDYIPGIVLLARGSAQEAANLGWSKLDTKEYLWEVSKIPWELVQLDESLMGREADWLVEGQPWPITKDPKNIGIVVAGGEQSGHNYWLGNPWNVTSKEIKLPAKWDALLKQAEEDLGPLPPW